jgi:hypothetical protein
MSNGSCPAGASPFLISLTDGHSFQFVAVDPDLIGCNVVTTRKRASAKG